MKHGGERRPHTKKCRERVLKAMGEDEEGREKIKKREEDINEQIARDVERKLREEEAKSLPAIECSKKMHAVDHCSTVLTKLQSVHCTSTVLLLLSIAVC